MPNANAEFRPKPPAQDPKTPDTPDGQRDLPPTQRPEVTPSDLGLLLVLAAKDKATSSVE